MKKENQIRSKYVQDSLADINILENKMEETTKESIRAMLSETVKNELNKILAEAEDGEDYEETEVEDTTMTDDSGESEETVDISSEEGDETPDFTDDTESTEDEFGGEGEDEWADFESFKTEDGEYDFSNADKETVHKVYKLLKNDDEVIVTDDNGVINIKDNETGAEYMINTDDAGAEMGGMSDMGGSDEEEINLDDTSFDATGEEEFNADDNVEGDDISFEGDDETVYEIALNDGDEITEDLGYTTNYQKKTAMDTPSNNEPAKSSQTYSMDAGVPTGTEKPYGKNKGDNTPFDKTVKEEEEVEIDNEVIDEEEEAVEEATSVGGFVQQNSTSKSHVPNSNGRSARNQSKGGEYRGTQTPRYSSSQMESIKRKAKAIFEENQEIKAMLVEMKDKLYKAAVTNKNLGQIIKLVTENTTTRDEKIDIIRRFGNEAKTIKQSDQLFESISKDLQKVNTMNNVNNSMNRTLTENSTKNVNTINETTVYQSNDLLESINLMHRINNL